MSILCVVMYIAKLLFSLMVYAVDRGIEAKMSLVAAELASLASPFADLGIVERAKRVLAKIVLPTRITRQVILLYIRKAFRTGVWRTLSPEARALLLLSSRIISVVKSRTLDSILRHIFVEIELHTFRGKALFTGIILAFRNLASKVSEILRDITAILFLGISYLNNPLMYRAHG